MLNILDQKRKNINNSNSLVSKQSSIVVLRKNKFKARIEKQITKEKEKIKNLNFAVNNIVADYKLSQDIGISGVNQGQQTSLNNINTNSFPNLKTNAFSLDNINFGFDSSSNNTSALTNKREVILRKRRPQLYKSTHGFRLSFCNLTDKEKKDQRASTYRKRTKNMRERDFFSRRQMQRDNESLFDCLQKYYYENDESFKKTHNRTNTLRSLNTVDYSKKYCNFDSLFGYTNNSQLFIKTNTLSKSYIYNYFNVQHRRRRRGNRYYNLANKFYHENQLIDDSDDDADLDSDIDDNETIHNKNNVINFNFNNQNLITFSSGGDITASRSLYNLEIIKDINSQDRRRAEMLKKRRQQYKSRSSYSIQGKWRRGDSEDDQLNDPNLTHIICDECCRKIKNHELYYLDKISNNSYYKDNNWIKNLNKINDINNSNSSNKPLICEYCRCIKDKTLCSISLTTDFSQKVIFSRRTKKRNFFYITSNYNITSKAYNPSLSAVPSAKAQRIKQYLKRTRIARKVQVWSRRKLFLMGLSNERQNLGNLLNITESYNDDLSFDNDQSLKITEPSMLNSILVPGIENPFQIVTLQSELELENNSELLFLFNQANELVKSEFSAKDMCVHLDSSLDEGLTVDIIVKEKVRTSSKLYCECNKHDDSESDTNFLKSNYFQFNNDNNNINNNNNNNNNHSHNNDNNFDSNYSDYKYYSKIYDKDSNGIMNNDYYSNNNYNNNNNNNNININNITSSHFDGSYLTLSPLDESYYEDASIMSYQNQSSSNFDFNDQSFGMTAINSRTSSWVNSSNSISNSSFDMNSSTTLINFSESQQLPQQPNKRIIVLPNDINSNFEEGEEDERCVYCHKLKFNRKNYLKYEGNEDELNKQHSFSRSPSTNSISSSRKAHSFSPRNVEVVAVMEYVFMKRYMWLEVIAVKQEYKGLGIGKLLMNRMTSIANAKDKDILLYSLNDVISFYKQFDFEFSPKFPHKPYHDGWFMTKRCKTPKNIFIPS
jgi:hypothetical protein